MKRLAIVGSGPTGIYTFFSLLKNKIPLSISIYEQAAQAGVGMPYSDDVNSRLMLANIASIEIPPIVETFIEWLKQQDEEFLARYGVERSALHDRQFLPRVLLGSYFRAQFLALLEMARKQQIDVSVQESCCVVDLEASPDGVKLWTEREPQAQLFDRVVIATGHVFPEDDEATRSFFPSPWSGLLEAKIPPCSVAVMGTSLSAIDAVMAVVAQHGEFVESEDGEQRFEKDAASEALSITLMSRSGILPEADFYCPIPYDPPQIATEESIEREIAVGSFGLLDRVFALVAKELETADPFWARSVGLATLDADSFAKAYFADRAKHNPFRWAAHNLREVEKNKREKKTVPWRYAILRVHEAVETIVPHLEELDRERFNAGLARVFSDNYAAIPSESIRRLLALRQASVIEILELGNEYEMHVKDTYTEIVIGKKRYRFDVFIDARGQKPLKTKDLPFPRLRQQLLVEGEEFPDVNDDYSLLTPDVARGRIAFGALPYLIHDQPFIQGITAAARIGEAMAGALSRKPGKPRRKMMFYER